MCYVVQVEAHVVKLVLVDLGKEDLITARKIIETNLFRCIFLIKNKYM